MELNVYKTCVGIIMALVSTGLLPNVDSKRCYFYKDATKSLTLTDKDGCSCDDDLKVGGYNGYSPYRNHHRSYDKTPGFFSSICREEHTTPTSGRTAEVFATSGSTAEVPTTSDSPAEGQTTAGSTAEVVATFGSTAEVPTISDSTAEGQTTAGSTAEAVATFGSTAEVPTTAGSTAEGQTTAGSTAEAVATFGSTAEVPTIADSTTELPTTSASTTEVQTTSGSTTEVPTASSPFTMSCSPQSSTTYSGCANAKSNGQVSDGVYYVTVGMNTVPAYCKMSLSPPRLVIQKRINGAQSFYQNWTAYEYGFGDLCTSFWWGNTNIKAATASYKELDVTLTKFDGNTESCRYDQFKVVDPDYTIDLGSGNANGNLGDSLAKSVPGTFVTHDRGGSVAHCANSNNLETGWWMSNDRDGKQCYELLESNLNGAYKASCCNHPMYDGIMWKSWQSEYTSMQKSEMSIDY